MVVLSLLAESAEPLSVARISDATGIARASLGRLLASLQADDAVRVDEAGRYRPTLSVLRPAMALLALLRVRDVGFPHLVELSRTVGYEVFLGLYEYPEIVFVESVFSLDGNVTSRLMYQTKPLLTSHTGRLLVALQPEAVQRQPWTEQIEQLDLDEPTRRELGEEMRRSRLDGFIYFDRTDEGSPSGLAVAILGSSELPVASITITRPRELDSVFLDEVLPRAQDAARRISAALGSRQVTQVAHL